MSSAHTLFLLPLLYCGRQPAHTSTSAEHSRQENCRSKCSHAAPQTAHRPPSATPPLPAIDMRRSNTKLRPRKSERAELGTRHPCDPCPSASACHLFWCSQYRAMPPESWKHLSTPIERRYAEARSQRIPPVQYINTVFSRKLWSSIILSATVGNSAKCRVGQRVAPSKRPISLSYLSNSKISVNTAKSGRKKRDRRRSSEE